MQTITIKLANGKTEQVTVRGFPLRQFETAAKAQQNGDEFTLIAIACDRPKDWIWDVSPESITPLATAMQQENQAFFEWHGRRSAMALTPAEMLRLQREILGPDTPSQPAQATTSSPGGNTSPASPRPPA